MKKDLWTAKWPLLTPAFPKQKRGQAVRPTKRGTKSGWIVVIEDQGIPFERNLASGSPSVFKLAEEML